MEYLVKMNEKLLKVFPRSFPKIKMEQTLIVVTILISLVTLVIHHHIYQLEESRGDIIKSKTDLIREKTIEMNDKLDSLELNCPENPACPVCPSCPVCPACNCPEEKEKVCPDCNCPTCPTGPVVPVVQKDTGPVVPTVQKGTGTGASGAKPFRETDGVDSIENSNNLFSNFYSLFNKGEEGDVPIVNTNKNSNKNSNTSKNSNNSNKNSNILEGEMGGFENVPGYAIIPER
jgi:hypothetical protein